MASALPVLSGELGMYEKSQGVALVLRGSYKPPGAAIGAALDWAGLHRVATMTGHRFLHDVAARLALTPEPAPHKATA